MSAGKKRWLYFLVVVLFPVFFSLLFAEIYIRFFSPAGYITPSILQIRAQSFETVPVAFTREIFPQKVQTIPFDKDTLVSINSKGYRGPEFEIKKSSGTTRIIIYGGSVVFDGYHDWPHQVEKILRQRGFSHVEVINAGIGGHSALDAFGRFFAEGHLFDPDYVILYTGWNDLKLFTNKEPLLRQFAPQRRQDPLLYYQGALDQWLCEFSQLYVRLRYRYIRWKFRMGPEGAQPAGHSSQISENALRQYRLTLETFADMSRNSHAVFILMPEARLLGPANTAKEKRLINYDSQTLTPEALWPATQRLEEIMQDVTREKKSMLIDTSPVSGSLLYLRDNSHPTEAGSRKLAEITADALEPLLRQRLLR